MLRVLQLCVVVSVLAGARAMDEDMAELAKMLRESCGAETQVDFSLIDQVNAGTPLMPDPKLKCYIKCLMEAAGMMSEGAIEVETSLALLDDDLRARTEGVIRNCGTQKGGDDCETAFLTQVCWQKGTGKDYFLV